jgi:hypothetical protein
LKQNGFEVLRQDKTGNSVETVFQLWIMYIHQHITALCEKNSHCPIGIQVHHLYFTQSLCFVVQQDPSNKKRSVSEQHLISQENKNPSNENCSHLDDTGRLGWQ